MGLFSFLILYFIYGPKTLKNIILSLRRDHIVYLYENFINVAPKASALDSGYVDLITSFVTSQLVDLWQIIYLIKVTIS